MGKKRVARINKEIRLATANMAAMPITYGSVGRSLWHTNTSLLELIEELTEKGILKEKK